FPLIFTHIIVSAQRVNQNIDQDAAFQQEIRPEVCCSKGDSRGPISSNLSQSSSRNSFVGAAQRVTFCYLFKACIGELKKEKGIEVVYLFVNIDGKKFVHGTLFADKLPQQ
ncbi:histone deacetylase 2a-like protein, partial [Striga asiatica]